MAATIKNIIFDLGGVLLNLDIQKSLDGFKQLGIVQIEELFRIGHASSFFKQYEIGTIGDDEFVEAARRLAREGTTAGDIVSVWNSMLLDFPASRVELLTKLQSRYRLFLFSNTNALHLEAFQSSYLSVYGTPLDGLFEKTYYSHLIRLRKPDTESFQFVIQDSGLEAAETLFIDDALVNVEGAQKAGLQGLHLAPGKTVHDLPSLNIEH